MNFLGFLAPLFGYVMEFIYAIVENYGWAIIIFTIAIRVLIFPLSLKQQKSTAKMSAYNPYIQEIQKKYANDKARQQEELVKFQQEHGYSMAAGCLPMIINMLALFGIIQVVYRPLSYILHIGNDAITQATELVNQLAAQAGVTVHTTGYMAESAIIGFVNDGNASQFAEIFGDKLDALLSFNMNFMGINLLEIPSLTNFPNINWALLIFPVLSLVTMIASQIITMKMSGQEMQGSMKWMPWMMSAFFVYFCFTVPVAFSLYYTISNILMFVQGVILKKMYDPEVYKAELKAQIEAKRAEKKKKKKVEIVNDEGKKEEKQVTEAELARMRLAMARKQDEEKYKD